MGPRCPLSPPSVRSGAATMGFAMCGAAEALRKPLLPRPTKGTKGGRSSADTRVTGRAGHLLIRSSWQKRIQKNMGGHLLTYRPAISLEIWAKTELQKQNKEVMPIIAPVA